ncbi:MAG: DNA primase small subunit domain-containing protein, partial [Candidatus Micrarchaeia archaeon]
VSHSAAYYERPGATPIEKKGWLGADLIFDLDLHAEGKYGVYAVLDQVKSDTIRLLEEFLIEDFGISKSETITVFSGNRGYHIHVRDRAYHSLGIEERREIADYVNGTGLNYLNFFEEQEVPGRKLTKKIGPKPSDFGYRGRFARAAVKALEQTPNPISPIFSNPEKRQKFIDGVMKGDWNKTSLADIVKRFEPIAKELPIRSIDTDVGVTQDVSKLIRVPNSIHGETGLMAKIIPYSELASFSPLDDALAFGMKETIKVEFIEPVPPLKFGKQTFADFKKDEIIELPEALAIFVLAKGSARVV